ncbi:unnamed protein product [Nippostrongylus brasiliensis]|uniref:Lipocalin-like domain-containing protein n=1 Tax=Nippostrongylus brasiliensis TaxID=27835 RepID=A0A0N4YH55_NIPBR|nr:unnamed protein product [Nippostrongylus brasiliensis]
MNERGSSSEKWRHFQRAKNSIWVRLENDVTTVKFSTFYVTVDQPECVEEDGQLAAVTIALWPLINVPHQQA